jgi:DNA-binding NarL/FixJ family response regulator
VARELRVMIVSPYSSGRAGLSALASLEPDVRVVGLVAGSADLDDAIPTAHPEVALADPASGDANSLTEALAEYGVALVLLADDRELWNVLAEGRIPGWAILPRDAEAAEIHAAIRAVAEGLVVLGRAAEVPQRETRSQATNELAEDLLTAREREVIQLLADGLPNKIIANRLSVSLHTVKFHVASILAKLGASSRTEAVTIGARRGLVTL